MARDKTLRALRVRLGLTQKELADKAGVSQRTIIRMEQGVSGNTATASAVADALGIKRAALLDLIDASRDAASRAA